MSHHPDQFFNMTGSAQYDPALAMYGPSFQPPFPGLPGPPDHFDGVAFWYRPAPQEARFDQNKMMYNQNVVSINSPLEPPVSIKHRRTRSGCFTCRHRRVKCDETRPVCERCKKGNRECHFPQPSSSSRRTDSNDPRNLQGKGSSQDSRGQSSQQLATVDDESEDDVQESSSPTLGNQLPNLGTSRARGTRDVNAKRKYAQAFDTRRSREQHSPASAGTLSPQLHNETSVSTLNAFGRSQSSSARPREWQYLNATMQEYLQFQRDHMTRYHYFLKLDPQDFIHNEFIDMALSFEPLLYAVVGFAAYHHTLQKPDGRFKDFWKYYCQSIRLLRKWLETHTDRNEAVLLTILQLTTFEECLGDWVSLAIHHRAAHSIFSAIYTYDSIMETEISRCAFDWLARTDVIASLMAGANTILTREWFSAVVEWHRSQIDESVLDVSAAMSYFVAKLRLVGYDMTHVFAGAATNPRTMQDFEDISKQMDDLRLEIQQLHDTAYPVRGVSDAGLSASGPDNTFGSRIPLFRDSLWPLNFIWIDWYGTQQMLKFQVIQLHQALLARARSQERSSPGPSAPQVPDFSNLPPEMEYLSLVQCQIFEAIERYPNAPPGAILGCQNSLAISAVFLKKEPEYTMWARRKLANLERMGYIWPPSLRKRMSQVWHEKEVLDWWLPNGEGKIPLLNEIRGVVEERNKEIEIRGGDERDGLREMKAVFETMDLGGGSARGRTDSVWSATGVDATGGGVDGGMVSSPSGSGTSGGPEDHLPWPTDGARAQNFSRSNAGQSSRAGRKIKTTRDESRLSGAWHR